MISELFELFFCFVLVYEGIHYFLRSFESVRGITDERLKHYSELTLILTAIGFGIYIIQWVSDITERLSL
jgi:TRAP-type mannitol/chloroaromatic compound transport system permease small subunit